MTREPKVPCDQIGRVAEHAVGTLPAAERSAFQAHLDGCPDCRQELAANRPVIDAFVAWPTDILRPPTSLWGRLAEHIGEFSDEVPGGGAREPDARWPGEPDWKEVAPGISCKLLATDEARDRVSMLVRLAPGVEYPPHTHAGVEELHLLDGELWIDDRKLHAGDYSRAEPRTSDSRVWSETGCTCVLVTSPGDVLA